MLNEMSSDVADFEDPELPAATEPAPQITGITVLSSLDAGSSNIWEFKVNSGQEDVVVNALLDAFDAIDEFSLADHSRGDYESCATYTKAGDQFEVKLGGHGWSADKRSLDRSSAVAEVKNQLKYNFGSGWHDRGQLLKRK